MIASCGFLEDELRGNDGRQCGKVWSVLEARVKRLGAEEQARRKKCKLRFSIMKKSKAFHQNYMKVGVKKLLREVHAVGIASTGRLKLSRQMAVAAGKKSTTSLSLFMEVFGLEVEEDLCTLATQYLAEGVWTENGIRSKGKLG